MAKIALQDFIDAVQLASDSLNVAFDDSITAGKAKEFATPQNPLRNLNALFQCDKDGVFSPSADLITAYYNEEVYPHPAKAKNYWETISA